MNGNAFAGEKEIKIKRTRTKVCGLALARSRHLGFLTVLVRLFLILESCDISPSRQHAFPGAKDAHFIDRRGLKTETRKRKK